MASVRRDELVLMYLKCGVMLANQVPLISALIHAKSESTSSRLTMALDQMIAEISTGETLADAMSHHQDVFPQAVLTLVRAAEETGAVDLVFRNLAEYSLYSSLAAWKS